MINQMSGTYSKPLIDYQSISDGYTILMCCAIEGDVANGRLLLAAKANVDLTDHQGRTAKELAAIHGRSDFVAMMELWTNKC